MSHRAPRTPRAPRPPRAPAQRPSLHSRTAQPSRLTTINVPMIFITILVGALAWFIGNFIYTLALDAMPRPLLIGAEFLILCVLLAAVVFGVSLSKQYFEENILTGARGGQGSAALILLAGCAAVMGAAALFQWIYGLSFDKSRAAPSAYIFLLDDSGSMEESDPDMERYSAISKVLAGMDRSFPYMLYRFADDVERVRDMAPISDGLPSLSARPDGQTAIRAALEQVVSDHRSGAWDGGEMPKVILLTDGFATDIDSLGQIDPVLERCAAEGLSVSTIGLGQADAALLSRIAEKTGGIFVDIQNASQLSEAMASAAGQRVVRDLLSAREDTGLGVLYGALRILFLTVLGLMVGLLMAVAYGFQDAVGLIAGSSAATALLGAMLMEFGTALGLSAKLMWLLLWVLVAMTMASKVTSSAGGTERDLTANASGRAGGRASRGRSSRGPHMR